MGHIHTRNLRIAMLRQGAAQGRKVLMVYDQAAVDLNFDFITNIMAEKIPSGVLAFLYRTRWPIGETFDKLKPKFGGNKPWASSEKKRLAQVVARLKKKDHTLPQGLLLMTQMTQRTVRLVRWAAANVWLKNLWKEACGVLAAICAVFFKTGVLDAVGRHHFGK